MKRLFAALVALALLTSTAAGGWLINSYRFTTAAPAAITLVGTASNTTIDGNDVTVTLPGGTAENDVVYAFISYGSDTNEVLSTVTSGYTKLADLFGDDNRNTNFGVFRKVMGGTPDTTVVFDVVGTLSETGAAGGVMVLRGVDTTTPEDATTTTATGIDGSQVDPPSITTVTNGAWVLASAGWTNPAVPTVQSGYSDFVTALGDDAQDSRVMFSRKEVATAGAENPAVFGNTVGAGTDSWGAASIAVRPGS